MGHILQLLRIAVRRGDKKRLNAWFNHRQPIELPKITSTRHVKARSFQSKLAAFNDLHNWHAPHLHPCFLQLLGLPQHIKALADSQSPFPLMGLVQINNRIASIMPLQNSDMTIHCQFSAIELHTHGITVDVGIEVTQSGKTCLRATSTYLYRMAVDSSSLVTAHPRITADSPSLAPLEKQAAVQFKENAGRKYARISGDYNPIHFCKWSAKLFGFKTSIAHGMHVLALALSRIENNYALLNKPALVSNQFVYPASLPCTTTLKCSEFTPALTQPLNFVLYNPKATRRKQVVLTGSIENVSTAHRCKTSVTPSSKKMAQCFM